MELGFFRAYIYSVAGKTYVPSSFRMPVLCGQVLAILCCQNIHGQHLNYSLMVPREILVTYRQ